MTLEASAADRAAALLSEMQLAPASGAASGRYLRSTPFRPGVRYWASSQPRNRQDMFGVQFYGEGCQEVPRFGAALERSGFKQRNPQTGQITFAKSIPFGSDGAFDSLALRRARHELDVLMAAKNGVLSDRSKPGSLRDFMLKSPLSDLEFPDPDREGGWRVTES